MKVETSDAVITPAFDPVNIIITIESVEELAAFWTQLNVNARDHIGFTAKKFGIRSFDLDGMNDVWKVVNNVAIKRGLKQ